MAASPKNAERTDPPEIEPNASQPQRNLSLGNRLQLAPGIPVNVPKKMELPIDEEQISEVGQLREFMEEDEINSLVESLKTLSNKPAKLNKKKDAKMANLVHGNELFGFKMGQPRQRMSKALGEIQVGSEFKEAGVLEEAMESGTRETMVKNLHQMISNSTKAGEKISGRK